MDLCVAHIQTSMRHRRHYTARLHTTSMRAAIRSTPTLTPPACSLLPPHHQHTQWPLIAHTYTYTHTYIHTYVHTHTAWPHTATPSSTCMRGIASAEPTLCPPVYSPRPHTYTQHHHPPRQSYKRTPADQHQHQHQHCHHHCCCTSVIHPSTSAHVFVHSDLVSQLTYVSGEYCTITSPSLQESTESTLTLTLTQPACFLLVKKGEVHRNQAM